MLSRVDPNLPGLQALCIYPTRELAIQNNEVLQKMGKYKGINFSEECAVSMAKEPSITTQVVIGTPITVKKWISPKKLGMTRLKIVVFDEADHMLAEWEKPEELTSSEQQRLSIQQLQTQSQSSIISARQVLQTQQVQPQSHLQGQVLHQQQIRHSLSSSLQAYGATSHQNVQEKQVVKGRKISERFPRENFKAFSSVPSLEASNGIQRYQREDAHAWQV